MSTRYVDASKGLRGQTGVAAYSTPSRPAARLEDALKVAMAEETIVVLDASEYAEGELVIDKPLTLTSAKLGIIKEMPNSVRYRSGSLPRLVPTKGRPQRVLRIQFAKDARPGRVVVSGFEIANGTASNTPGDPVWGVGGGIAVADLDDVLIKNCYISDNKTVGIPLRTYSTATFKDTVINRLTDIIQALPGSDPGIAQLISVPARKALDQQMPSSRVNSPLFGQCFGGGVCFAWSSGRIEGCGIVKNHANGRGSGIAVIGYGWPTITGCLIRENSSGDQGFARRDGGGIGAEISVPEKLGRNVMEADLLKALTDWLATVPTLSLLARVGVATILGLIRAVQAGKLSAKEVVLKILYIFARAYLLTQRWSSWSKASIESARTRAIQVSGCKIEHNNVFDDGGGIYCSVLSRLAIDGSGVINNNARLGGGGGIRMSMGSDLTLSSTAIVENRSNGESVGGGGLAVRNGAVTISGSSSAHSTFRNNQAGRWAGGGLLLESKSEGNLAGIPDMWHGILIDVFEFSNMTVKIDEFCETTGNKAGTTPGAACHGQGGGIYILHVDFPDAADLHIEIKEFARNFTGNSASSKTLLGKKPIHPCHQISKVTDQIALIDLASHVDDGDTDIPKHLGPSWRHLTAASTTLTYDS